MPTEMQRRLLRDVREFVRDVFIGGPGLEAFWTDANPGKDAEIYFVSSGKRHVVHVQVGANFASVNVMRYGMASLGHGIVHGDYLALDQGVPRRPDILRIGEDLAAALAAHPSSYEPARGPGVALHHGFPALLNSALDVFAEIPGGPYEPVVNADPLAGDGGDMIAFVDPDGAVHPVSLGISAGFDALVYVDGDLVASLRRDPSAGSLASRLRQAMDEAAPSPGP